MIGFEYLNKIDVPIFTITFCAIILIIYILDNFLIIPATETVSLKEKLWSVERETEVCISRSAQRVQRGGS